MSNLVSFSNGQEYTERVMEKLGISPDGENYARVDAAKAAEYKTKAMEELAAQGVTFPWLLTITFRAPARPLWTPRTFSSSSLRTAWAMIS